MRTLIPKIHGSTDQNAATPAEVTVAELAQLADRLVEGGTALHTEALTGLADRIAPVSPALASVLMDVRAPEIARLRAFGRASTIVANAAGTVAQAPGTGSPEFGPIHYRLTA